MRLIDADALMEDVKKVAFTDDMTGTLARGLIKRMIEAAPTVDAERMLRLQEKTISDLTEHIKALHRGIIELRDALKESAAE